MIADASHFLQEDQGALIGERIAAWLASPAITYRSGPGRAHEARCEHSSPSAAASTRRVRRASALDMRRRAKSAALVDRSPPRRRARAR